jgi:ABC-type glycerol-3-phosphate transport system substrate-binding protein
MKKALALLLTLAMILSLGLGVATADDAQEMTTLKILSREWNSGYFAGRDTQVVWQEAEKMFHDAGIDFDFEIIVDGDQYKTTIQTRLASAHDLPDLFYGGYTSIPDLLDLADLGIVLKVNEILEITKGNAYNFYYGGNGDQARKLISDVNGDFYWLPRIQVNQLEGENAGTSMCMCIRKDWLEKVDLPVPTSLDEFTAALKAFQDNDVNGNGVVDEFAVSDTSYFNVGMNLWFGIETCTADSIGINLTENQVHSAWYNPNIKEYFTYVRGLVEQGLLSADYIGSDASSSADLAGNKIAACEYYPVGTYQEASVIAGGCPEAYYIGIYPFDAVEGTKAFYSEETPYLVYLRHCVSNAAEDKLEAVARYFDVIYSDDYINLMEWGVEGKTYEVQADGTYKNLCGTMSTQERYDAGLCAVDALYRYFMPNLYYNERLNEIQNKIDGGYPEKGEYELATKGYEPKTPNDNTSYYALSTAEETEILAQYSTDLETASRELAANLCLGAVSIDELDAGVENLKALGLDEVLAVRAAQYARAIGD